MITYQEERFEEAHRRHQEMNKCMLSQTKSPFAIISTERIHIHTTNHQPDVIFYGTRLGTIVRGVCPEEDVEEMSLYQTEGGHYVLEKIIRAAFSPECEITAKVCATQEEAQQHLGFDAFCKALYKRLDWQVTKNLCAEQTTEESSSIILNCTRDYDLEFYGILLGECVLTSSSLPGETLRIYLMDNSEYLAAWLVNGVLLEYHVLFDRGVLFTICGYSSELKQFYEKCGLTSAQYVF